VVLQLSVFDKNTAVAARGQKANEE
jgi:hypothetical protein